MPRAIGRDAEVLPPRGGVNSGTQTKWTEGREVHTPLNPPFADYLNNNRMSNSEDSIRDFGHGYLAIDLGSIKYNRFSDHTALAVLSEPLRGSTRYVTMVQG
jgi:hypothetical protein